MRRLAITAVFLVSWLLAGAQEIVYTDASVFQVYGQAFEPSGEGPRYRRFPAEVRATAREPLKKRSDCSAGLYIRFRSDAPEIHARWTNTGKHMAHMTDCGTGGLDLYALLDGEWRFVGAGFSGGAIGPEHQKKLVGNMEPVMREYMLYLSLYDEVKTLEIGVPEGCSLRQPIADTPRADSPVVMYGTSILQGCSASRPGMAHSNIIARRLDRTVINLGFSGNAFLDLEVARLMAGVPNPSAFVLDYVPNASEEMINEKGEEFFRILRDAHPEVPVIFVEDPQFSHSRVDMKIAKEISGRNTAQKALFHRLKKSGEKRIYYVPSKGLMGEDGEAAVDGTHFTDLGMVRYADKLVPVLKKALRR